MADVVDTTEKAPELFGRYQLLERIATGGSSEIFLARDPQAQSAPGLVVIKRLRSDRRREREAAHAFVDEGNLLRRLEHPCIVKLLDDGELGGWPFLVLEHVWGETLDTLTWICAEQRKPFPVNAALYIGAEVAGALAHAHANQGVDGKPSPVIHRDVTFGNVMISYTGQVKLLDFGIAKADHRLARTRVGQVKGTLFYVSPEQLTGGEASQRTDIYQLGVLLYKLLVGREPFEAGPQDRIMRAIATGALIPPSVAVPGFPRLIEAVLLRASARDPAARYGSAGELRAELRELLGTRLGQGPQLLARMMQTLCAQRFERQRFCIQQRLKGLAVEEHVIAHCRTDRSKGEPSTVDVQLARLLRKVDLLTLATSGDGDAPATILERLLKEADRFYGAPPSESTGDLEPDSGAFFREPTEVSASTFLNTAWEMPQRPGSDASERSDVGSDGDSGGIDSPARNDQSASGPAAHELQTLVDERDRELSEPLLGSIVGSPPSGGFSTVDTDPDTDRRPDSDVFGAKTLIDSQPPPGLDSGGSGSGPAFEAVPDTDSEQHPQPSAPIVAPPAPPAPRPPARIPVLQVRDGMARASFREHPPRAGRGAPATPGQTPSQDRSAQPGHGVDAAKRSDVVIDD